jgi:DNA-binding MarR family transcriptional regulator
MTAPTLTTASAAELLLAFRAVVKRLEQAPLAHDIKRQWAAAGLAPRHVAVLLRVVSDQGLSVTTLAERLGVSLATASQLVTDLESGGILERVSDPTDRRRTLVQVADSHRAMADEMVQTRLQPVQRAIERMRPAEHKAFLRGLTLMAEELAPPHDNGRDDL